MGCINEYVSHCVNLWKGRIDSQAPVEPDELPFGKGEKVGEDGEPAEGACGMEEHGHASPRDTSSMAVRLAGQIGARPVIRTFHRTGKMTIGIEDAWVVGCERR
jgi:hypothetical protein